MNDADFSESELQMISAAKAIASEAHEGQVRTIANGATEPYVNHPMRVARFVLHRFGALVSDDMSVVAAAVLHDVLEDCPADQEGRYYERIYHECGVRAAGYTDLMSKPRDRAFRNKRYKARLLTGPPAVMLIKLADRIDNLEGVRHAGWAPRRLQAYAADSADLYRIACAMPLRKQAAWLHAALLDLGGWYRDEHKDDLLPRDGKEDQETLQAQGVHPAPGEPGLSRKMDEG
jgi:(p)ppGpp synthase/HD superfamily hydrolase